MKILTAISMFVILAFASVSEARLGDNRRAHHASIVARIDHRHARADARRMARRGVTITIIPAAKTPEAKKK